MPEQHALQITRPSSSSPEGDWVTLTTCENAGEADMLASFFDPQGIVTRLPDEFCMLGNTWSLHANVYRRIEVARHHFEAACELLATIDRGKGTES